MIENQNLLNKDEFKYVEHQLLKPTKFIFHQNSDLKLTIDCINKINELKNQNSNNIIRIIISGGGCNGYQYDFKNDLIENVGTKTRDITLIDENNKLLMVFDLFSEFYIQGSTINYISTFMESGFRIENNPKAKASCGCKKSFSSDEFYDDEEEEE